MPRYYSDLFYPDSFATLVSIHSIQHNAVGTSRRDNGQAMDFSAEFHSNIDTFDCDSTDGAFVEKETGSDVVAGDTG